MNKRLKVKVLIKENKILRRSLEELEFKKSAGQLEKSLCEERLALYKNEIESHERMEQVLKKIINDLEEENRYHRLPWYKKLWRLYE